MYDDISSRTHQKNGLYVIEIKNLDCYFGRLNNIPCKERQQIPKCQYTYNILGETFQCYGYGENCEICKIRKKNNEGCDISKGEGYLDMYEKEYYNKTIKDNISPEHHPLVHSIWNKIEEIRTNSYLE